MKFIDYMDTDFLGAGIVFKTLDRKVLILQKLNGKWSFPGGHREKGERPIDTAKRESLEEIGTIPMGKLTNMIPYIKTENQQTCYSFIMEIDDEFIPSLSNEHVAYKWVSVKDLDSLQLSGAVKDLWPNLKRYII